MRSQYVAQVVLFLQFLQGAEHAILGIHILTPKTPPCYGLEMVPRIILVTCEKKFSQFGGHNGGGPMP